MKNLHQGAEEYLELRRSLGFKLKRPCRFIREFVRWLQDRGETQITTRHALEWATEPQHLRRAEWAANPWIRAVLDYDRRGHRGATGWPLALQGSASQTVPVFECRD
jgi:hypothetical protein